MYAVFADGRRIRVGEGLPDETTPPPPTEECADCNEVPPPLVLSGHVASLTPY